MLKIMIENPEWQRDEELVSRVRSLEKESNAPKRDNVELHLDEIVERYNNFETIADISDSLSLSRQDVSYAIRKSNDIVNNHVRRRNWIEKNQSKANQVKTLLKDHSVVEVNEMTGLGTALIKTILEFKVGEKEADIIAMLRDGMLLADIKKTVHVGHKKFQKMLEELEVITAHQVYFATKNDITAMCRSQKELSKLIRKNEVYVTGKLKQFGEFSANGFYVEAVRPLTKSDYKNRMGMEWSEELYGKD